LEGRNEMKLPEFELIQPHSVEEACCVLGEHNRKAVVLAGGTFLMVGLRYRLSKPAVVIDLKGLTEPDYVGRNECALLAQAAQLPAVPPIRNGATIGGNLCLDTRSGTAHAGGEEVHRMKVCGFDPKCIAVVSFAGAADIQDTIELFRRKEKGMNLLEGVLC
jgi:FAD binding domain in molybdopterin dehydrogenase